MSRLLRITTVLSVSAGFLATGPVGLANAADTTPPSVTIVAPSLTATATSSPVCPQFIDPTDANRLLALGPVGVHALPADADGVIANVQFLYDVAVPGHAVQHLVSPVITESPYFFQVPITGPAGAIVSIVARAENAAGLVTNSAALHWRVKGVPPSPSGIGDESVDKIPAPAFFFLPTEDRVRPDVLLYPGFGNPAASFRDCVANRPNLADIQAVYFFARDVNEEEDPVVIASSFKAPFDVTWAAANPILPPLVGHSYDLTIKAFGIHGSSLSSLTKRVSVAAVSGETVPPTATFTSPEKDQVFDEKVDIPSPNPDDDDAVTTKGWELSATIDASDNTAVGLVELFDNGVFVARDTTAPYVFDWTTTVQDKHELTARVIDVDGNVFTTPKRIVYVDPPVPTASKTFLDGVEVSFSRPVDFNSPNLDFGLKVRVHDTGADVPVVCEGCTGSVAKVGLFRPTGFLTIGEKYDVVIDPELRNTAGTPVNPDPLPFRVSGALDQGAPTVVHRWRQSNVSAALGGSFISEHLAGARADYVFRGTSITWFTTQGPAFGKANVAIDGKTVAIVNNGATSTRFGVPVFKTSVARGTHTITITVRGERGLLGGSDSNVAIDAFNVTDGTFGFNDLTPNTTQRWRGVAHFSAFGGSFVESDSPNAAIQLDFRGTTVDWITVTSYTMGRAQVFIDGVLRAVVDNYSPTTRFGVVRRITVPDGVHRLQIRPMGQKNPAAKSAKIVVDALSVP